MLNVTVTGLTEVIQRFSEMPSKVHDGLLAEITKQALDLQRYVVTEKLSGQVLNKITGKLASSIQHDVTDSGSSIIGRVYSNNSVSYAAAQEFGLKFRTDTRLMQKPCTSSWEGRKFLPNLRGDSLSGKGVS